MKRLALGAGALGLFCACVALVFALLGGFAAPRAAKAYTHIHCDECGLELSYTQQLLEKPCPHCGPQAGRMSPTVGPARSGSDRRADGWGRLFAAVVLSAVMLPGAFYSWVVYRRARCQSLAESAKRILICRCPFCTRRIGYLAKKIGAGTTCPRCKTAFTLPDELAAEPV